MTALREVAKAFPEEFFGAFRNIPPAASPDTDDAQGFEPARVLRDIGR